MKTNRSCLSKRLGRMGRAYPALRRLAIAGLLWLAAGPAAAAPLICVLVPHFKDEYWLSVANGIETRAAERGLEPRFFEAGGYRALQSQIGQIAGCESLHPAAILIGAVSSDDPALLAAVARAAQSRPVIGLVNELHSDALAARIGVDWREMGERLGAHLGRLYPAGGPPIDAVLLSGPPEAGWPAPLESGLRRGLAGSAVRIGAVYGADTGTGEQLRLLEQALADRPRPGLIIGPAPAIEAAMALFRDSPGRPVLAATYVSHSVARGLVGSQVIAAPFDDPMGQGSLAVDAVAAARQGVVRPALSGPAIRVIAAGTDPAAIRLSPAGYFPALD